MEHAKMPLEFKGDFDEWMLLLRHFFPIRPGNETHIDFIEYDFGIPFGVTEPPTLHADAYWNGTHLSRWVGISRSSTPVNWTARERHVHNYEETTHIIPDYVEQEVQQIRSRRF